ncbi:MAG: hypothetical protein ACKO96_33590 [Flammeovirgaceae bacterium]
MMKHLICLAFLFVGCVQNSNDNKILTEAAAYHSQAVALAKKVTYRIDSLNRISMNDKSKLMAIEKDFKEWANDLVGVPGFEGEKNHDHEHSHEQIQATSSQLLDIQKELYHRIEKIHANLTNVK